MSENSTPSSATSGDLVLYHGPEFGMVPKALITDTSLTVGARLLCALLWTYRNKDTGEAFPSQERMAKELGCSQRSVRRWLKALAGEGWLRRTKRIQEDPEWRGNQNACLYEIYWSKGKQRETGHQSPNRPDTSVLADRTPESAEHTNRTDHKNIGGDSPPQISISEKALLDARVYPRTIMRLIEAFPEQRILQKAAHWKGGKLVRAIEENWELPRQKGSGERDYAAGQFADFWDGPAEGDSLP